MFRLKRATLAGATILATAWLGACSTNNAGTAAGEGNVLRVAQQAFPSTLDPHDANESAAAIVHRHLFQTLVTQTPEMEIVPNLATSWQQVNDTTIEFTLRQGVTFHNGDELTADDVVFSLLRALDNPRVSHIVGMLDASTVEAVDRYTVRVGTAEPFSPLLNHLSHPAGSIVPQQLITEIGDAAFADNPVGSGPFQYASRIHGDFVELDRFEDYTGTATDLDGMIFRTIIEGSSRIIELETGEIDVVLAVDPSDVSRVDNDANLVLHRAPDLRTEYLGFNVNNEYLSNVLVRRAIAHAINTEDIIHAVFEGIGARALGPIGPNVFGAYAGVEGHAFDPALSLELLAEAGLADGFELNFLIDEAPLRVAQATIIQNQLAQIGITASITTRDWATYIQETGEGAHDIFLLGWTTVTGDADYGLYALFHSRNAGAPGNRSFFENAELDALLDEAKATTDEATRIELYRQAQLIIVEEAPWAFIRHGENIVGLSGRVQNFELHPAAHHNLSVISLEN